MLWPVGPNRSVPVGFQEFLGLCGLPHFPMKFAISSPGTSFPAEPFFNKQLSEKDSRPITSQLRQWTCLSDR